MRRIAIAVAFVSVAASCGPSPETIVVGAIYPTGGHQGPGGIEEYRGVELAAEYVNHNGGVGGRRVRVDLQPAEHREQAPHAVDVLAGKGVSVVLGSYGSTISAPAANAAASRGLVFWETGAVGDLPMAGTRTNTAFRFPVSGRVLGRQAVAFVRDELDLAGPTTYTVAYVDDVYGRSVGLGAVDEIKRSGLRLGAQLPYDLRSVDYSELVDRIARAHTDVLVVASYLEDAIAMRREVVRRGLQLKANIGTSSSYCMLQFGELLGGDAVGLFASDKPDGRAVDPTELTPEAGRALRWARRTYQKRFDTAMTAPALTGFSGALALFRFVLPEAKDGTSRSIERAALSADVPVGGLPNGSGLRFAARPGEARANERGTSVVWEWVAPRTRAVVWPPSHASHAVVPPR